MPGAACERHNIWDGVLTWSEESKNPNEPRLTFRVPCRASANREDGELVLTADSWPQDLTVRFVTRELLGNIGGRYIRNSKPVLFQPQECETLELLTDIMSSGYAGIIQFNTISSPYDIRVLFMLYTLEMSRFLGFIPGDQTGFIRRLYRLKRDEQKQYQ